MLIGEAPGSLENKTGYPFVGTAGRILEQTIKHCRIQFKYLITNTVCCRPVDIIYLDAPSDNPEDVARLNKEFHSLQEGEDYELHSWNRDPSPPEIEACRPHIDELVSSWEPHGVVYLGKIAQSYKTSLPRISLLHPAYIARMEYKLGTVIDESHKLEKFILNLEGKIK